MSRVQLPMYLSLLVLRVIGDLLQWRGPIHRHLMSRSNRHSQGECQMSQRGTIGPQALPMTCGGHLLRKAHLDMDEVLPENGGMRAGARVREVKVQRVRVLLEVLDDRSSLMIQLRDFMHRQGTMSRSTAQTQGCIPQSRRASVRGST